METHMEKHMVNDSESFFEDTIHLGKFHHDRALFTEPWNHG